MIDPLEVAIQFLLARSELSALSGRIGSKHQYGETWSKSDASVVVILDDSDPNVYVPMMDVRLEVWCMAGDDSSAVALWQSLVEISRGYERVEVSTSNGAALLYSFLPESGPSYLPVSDLSDVRRVLSFWRLQAHEVPLGD